MKVPSELIDFIERSDNFFIATHINPEGDAIGSSLALHLAFKKMEKESTVFNRDSVPETYKFLPQWSVVANVVPERVDNLLLLDCNSLQRAGLENCSVGVSAVIDHHPITKNFGDIQWILPDVPASGLMIYYLIKEMGIELTEEIAANLYTAIAIDTGIFRYSNTTAESVRVASELIEHGASASFIADRLFNNFSKGRFLLLKEALNGIELYDGVAVVVIRDEFYKVTGTTDADTENFVNYPLMMEEVKVSVLFRQLDNDSWKVSLRSKGDIDISRVAAAFEGGGHRNAAGCRIGLNLEDAREKLLNTINDLVSHQ